MKALSKTSFIFPTCSTAIVTATWTEKGRKRTGFWKSCLEALGVSPPARVTLSRAQGSKLTTMNLRVMPVALVENKTQRGGPPTGASGSDKKTAASWLCFEIYGYILSTYIVPDRLRCARARVSHALWISPHDHRKERGALDRFHEGLSVRNGCAVFNVPRVRPY